LLAVGWTGSSEVTFDVFVLETTDHSMSLDNSVDVDNPDPSAGGYHHLTLAMGV
jgi:hypothetical protein